MATSSNRQRRPGRAAIFGAMALALSACAGRTPVAYEPAPGSYFEVPVRQGDTVPEIARRYQVNEDDIVAINNLHPRDTRLSGKTVRVPAYGHLKDDRRSEGNRLARNAPVESRPVAAKAKERTGTGSGPGRRDGVIADRKSPAANPAQKAQTTKLDPPKPQAQPATWWQDWLNPMPNRQAAPPKKFLWPVNGQVVSKFGPGAGQSRNDGINILAPRGTPVRAAEAGTVTYVGDQIKGYGNLVLIKHDNGYVTAYAHADRVTVTRGEKVARGQPIGFAGTTGGVKQPQLHFELRYNAKPVDPVPYLVATNES